MRLLLVLANLAVPVRPRWSLLALEVRPYDAIAAAAAVLLAGSLVVTIVRTAIELEHVDAAERR
jgi:hypothetical protein